MGKKFNTINNVQLWSKVMTKDRTAFVFLNPEPYGTPTGLKISLRDLGLISNEKYDFYEMFSGDLIGTFEYNSVFGCSVNPSGSVYAFWAEPIRQKLLVKSKSKSAV